MEQQKKEIFKVTLKLDEKHLLSEAIKNNYTYSASVQYKLRLMGLDIPLKTFPKKAFHPKAFLQSCHKKKSLLTYREKYREKLVCPLCVPRTIRIFYW